MEPMKTELQKKIHAAKQEALLETLSPFFESEGFHRLKMQDIAAYLGISVGALYNLFESKEALFYAYVAYQIGLFERRFKEVCAALEDPRKALAAYVEMKFEVFRQKRRAIEDPIVGDPLFFLKMNTNQTEPAAPIFAKLAELFDQLSRRLPLKDSDTLRLAYLFNAYTTGFVEYWFHTGKGLDDDPNSVVDRFLEGNLL